MRNLFVLSGVLFRKDPGDLDRLSQAQDDVLIEGFRMRRVNVLLRTYLEEPPACLLLKRSTGASNQHDGPWVQSVEDPPNASPSVPETREKNPGDRDQPQRRPSPSLPFPKHETPRPCPDVVGYRRGVSCTVRKSPPKADGSAPGGPRVEPQSRCAAQTPRAGRSLAGTDETRTNSALSAHSRALCRPGEHSRPTCGGAGGPSCGSVSNGECRFSNERLHSFEPPLFQPATRHSQFEIVG